MRDIIKGNGQPHEDLSKRLADNVLEAIVAYMNWPSANGAEQVHALSTALSSLSLLAIAEQMQTLVAIVAEEHEVVV